MEACHVYASGAIRQALSSPPDPLIIRIPVFRTCWSNRCPRGGDLARQRDQGTRPNPTAPRIFAAGQVRCSSRLSLATMIDHRRLTSSNENEPSIESAGEGRLSRRRSGERVTEKECVA